MLFKVGYDETDRCVLKYVYVVVHAAISGSTTFVCALWQEILFAGETDITPAGILYFIASVHSPTLVIEKQ